MNILMKKRPLCFFVQVLVLAMATGITSQAVGQGGTGKTVIERATEQFESSPLSTISLGQGIYIFSGDGGNVTAIADQASTLVIDSGMPSRISELSDAIFKTTKRPVVRLVNTHWHFDHTGGNTYFGSSGVIITAQENVKKQLSSVQDVPFVGLRDGHYPSEALPGETYSSSMSLHHGPQGLTLENYGSAHTDGDTIVYIRPANVAVVGDIFSNHVYPIIDLASGGSIDGLIGSVDRILAQLDDQTKIVPGHGPVAKRADLQDYRGMLVQIRQNIKDLIAAGKTMDEVVGAAPTKEFDAKWGGGYVTADVFTKMVFSSLIGSGNAKR